MIYFDNSATTPIDSEVFDAMLPYLKNEYGNPSSKYYTLASTSKKAVDWSREQIANLINSKPEEIIFTSCASESNNLIIKGVADYKKYYEGKGNHIITSPVEHKSVLNTCKFLNGEIYSNNDATFSFDQKSNKVDRGYSVTFLSVNNYGQVETPVLKDSITASTILVSVLWGNNEIGTLNDIGSLSSFCKDHDILFHSDATQVLGKINIDVDKTPVDFLSFSAHKIYGPKGIGAVFIRGDEYGLPPISSLIHGGEQEQGIRSGTLPVHNIVGFGKAAEIARKKMNEYIKGIQLLEQTLRTQLMANFDNIDFLGHPTDRIPGIVSVVINENSFNNERFIKIISDRVCISTGSACSSGKPSYVLESIGRKGDARNVLRISISKYTTIDQINEFIQVMKDEL